MINKLRRTFSQSGPKLFLDLISLFSGQGFSMMVSFLAFAYVARQLSAEDYGMVELAISIAAFGALVIECGAGTIGVRELAKRRQDAARIASQVVVARAMVMLVVLPLAALAAYIAAPDAQALWLLWLFVISLLAAPFKQDWLLQGHDMMHQAALAQPVRMLAFTIGVFVFLRGADNAIVVGWIELAAVALVTTYYLFAQYRWTAPFVTGWRLREAIYYLKEGISVGLSNILWAFMLYAPIYLIASMGEATQAAWLGAANRIVISLLTLSFIYHFNLYPVMTRLVHDDKLRWERLVTSSIRLVSWGAVAIALVLSLFAADIAALVFGAKFAAAGPALTVLAWALPLRMISGHSRWSLIAAGGQKYLLQAEVAGVATLLAVAITFIPLWGAAGAAAGFVAAIIVSFSITQVHCARLVAPNRPLRAMWQPFALAAGLMTVGHFVEISFWAQAGSAALAYGGLLVWNFKGLYADLVRVAYAKE